MLFLRCFFSPPQLSFATARNATCKWSSGAGGSLHLVLSNIRPLQVELGGATAAVVDLHAPVLFTFKKIKIKKHKKKNNLENVKPVPGGGVKE